MDKEIKILIVGSNAPGALEGYYKKYLNTLGFKVALFPAQDLFFEYYSKRISAKILFRLGLSSIEKRIGGQLMEFIEKDPPKIILVFKGMEVQAQFWKNIKVKFPSIKLVNYNPDNPFIFTGRGSGNRNITDSFSLFDAHITYSLDILDEIKARGKFGYWLPFGYDFHAENLLPLSESLEIIRCCFVGTGDAVRVKFLNSLAAAGLPIDVYGTRWNRKSLNKKISLFGPVFHDEMYQVLRNYRIQFNFLRKHNADAHGMRTFEIPAAGGIQVANRSRDHKRLFEEGKEIFLFEDEVECINISQEILKLSFEEASVIRTASVNKSLEGGYDYQNRAEQMAGMLNEVLIRKDNGT